MTESKIYLTNEDITRAAEAVAEIVKVCHYPEPIKLYGIPRGGVPAAYAVSTALYRKAVRSWIVDEPANADLMIDDLYDSGATAKRYRERYSKPVYTLFTKQNPGWLVFPWERTDSADASADDFVIRLLQFIGEDPNREGLRETPARFQKALREWFSGYRQEPSDVFKAFKDGAEDASNGIVVVRNIPLYSFCEHHIAPIFGQVTIGYIPNGKIIGLSKMKRLIDVYARRLQVQERLTNQIVEAVNNHLRPLGSGVIIKARHMCMESRGINCPISETVTSALRGVFMEKSEARMEFLELAK